MRSIKINGYADKIQCAVNNVNAEFKKRDINQLCLFILFEHKYDKHLDFGIKVTVLGLEKGQTWKNKMLYDLQPKLNIRKIRKEVH